MSHLFKQKSRREFAEYTEGLFEFITQRFPTCSETPEVHKQFSSASEEELQGFIEQWVAVLTQPLNTKKTKYAKAIERITKTPAIIMHAMMYHDMDSLNAHIQSPLEKKLRLFTKYSDDTLTEDDRKMVWKFVEKIGLSAFEALEQSAPIVPTRQEIQDNIKTRKKTEVDDGPPSMQKAFMTHINALCKIWNQPAVLDSDDNKIKSWMQRWSQFNQKEVDGVKNSVRCTQKDPTIIKDLRKEFPEMKIPANAIVNDSVWVNIGQLNSFSTVVDAIPSSMMGRIEDMASKLADDIVSGKTDMASVNLNDIGQQVLSQCNTGEMDKFADNIETLLPALQSFQQQMPSIPGLPPVPMSSVN